MFSFSKMCQVIILQEEIEEIIKIPVPSGCFQPARGSSKEQIWLEQNIKEIEWKEGRSSG